MKTRSQRSSACLPGVGRNGCSVLHHENSKPCDEKMIVRLSSVAMWLPVIAALLLCTACTGINEKQRSFDPVVIETQRMRDVISVERADFFFLMNEYGKNRERAHLERMSELMELVRDELERAEYFQKNQRYYRKGIDYERWKSAGETFDLCRKTLCEMMLATGELHMTYGDREYGIALLNAVASGFEGEDVAGYVDQARDFLQKVGKEEFPALPKKTAFQAEH